jgi:hypothetical protein
LVVCWLFVSLSAHLDAQTTVNLSSAGTLKDVAGIENVTHLMLTGEIDARDVAFMNNSIPYLAELDLSGTTIVGYKGEEGTDPDEYNYPANEMPRYSFYNDDTNTSKTSLTSVVLPTGVTSIGHSAFSGCSNLTSINIPAGVTSIGYSAFSGCSSLTSINIPDGLTSIESTFSGCSSLTSITLPAGLISFEYGEFSGCNNLTSITNLNPAPISFGDDIFSIFSNVNVSGCELKVPSSAVAAYQAADLWKEFNITGGGVSFSVIANSCGSVTGHSSGLYPENTNIHLTAFPAYGYSFMGWKTGGTVISSDTAYNFILTGDTVITAVFGKTGVYNLSSAGTLKNIADIETITHLTLTGEIDARDIAFMRDSIPFLPNWI